MLKRMRHVLLAMMAAACAGTIAAQQTKGFTLQQVMSAPYANQLTAAPTGPLFAWVEDAEGRHNLYVGGENIPARALTHNTDDDGQDIRQLAWSPDAKYIAYTYGAESGADGRPANPAHLQRPTPLNVIVQPVAAGAKPVVMDEGRLPLFSRDGQKLFYVRSGQIWVADLATESSRQLVYDRGSASALTLSPDGRTLAFISRRHEVNEPSHSFLALYSLTTHTLSFPAPSTGEDLAPAFSPDGNYLAWLRQPFTEADAAEFALNRVSATPWSIQLMDVADGKTRTLYSPEPSKPGSVLPIPDDDEPYLLWSANDDLIFYSEADGWDHLYLLRMATKQSPILLTKGDFEVEGAIVANHGKLLLYSSNASRPADGGPVDDPGLKTYPDMVDQRHLQSLELSPLSADPRTILFTNAIETHPQVSSNGTIAALWSNAHVPMQAVLVNTNGPETVKTMHEGLFAPPYPGPSFVNPQRVEFKSPLEGGTVAIRGQLFLPKQTTDPSASPQDDNGKVKRPALIFMHGGPRRQMLLGYPGMEYYSNAYAMNQYLASRGFIVLSVNYRCGIGYGLNFRQCDHEGATGAAEYNDILAAAKYLQSRPDVDAKRIGLWGGSYGGYLTALGLARNSDIFAAGVDFHGVHDWNLEDNASDWKRGDSAEQDAIGKEALASSPLGDISHWHSPILLIHGDNDPSVAYAQTPRLADALRARNASLPKGQQVDVEELIFPDEVHEFLLHKDWLAAYTAAAAFFERTLKP